MGKNTKKKTRNLKSIFSIFKKSIVILIDIFLFYLLIASLANIFFPKHSAKFVGIAGFPVASNSMAPFIQGPKSSNGLDGDFVFIIGVWDPTTLKPVSFSGQTILDNPEKKPNPDDGNSDVVIFENPDYSPQEKSQDQKRFIIHRVVSNNAEKKRISTWGDANDGQLPFEKKIPYDRIVGKYICKDSSIIPSIKSFFASFFTYLVKNPLYITLLVIYLIIIFFLLYEMSKVKKTQN